VTGWVGSHGEPGLPLLDQLCYEIPQLLLNALGNVGILDVGEESLPHLFVATLGLLQICDQLVELFLLLVNGLVARRLSKRCLLL